VTLLVPALAHSGVEYGSVREADGPLPEARLAVERLQREQPQASVQIDPTTGLVRTLADLRDRHALAGRGIERATAFVDEHRTMLLGDRAVAELAVSNLDSLATSTHVRYQQVYRGLPVFGARLSVHLDARGQVRIVHSSAQPRIEIDPTPDLTAADALRVARGRIRAAELRGQPRVTLGVLPLAGRARLAYRVEIATLEPADWQLDVDARSGAVLGQTNLLMRVEGEGVVVDENPDTTPELARRPFRDLDGGGILKGAFADVYSVEARSVPGLPGPVLASKRLSQAGDHRFTAPAGDPRFDEQMLYYHVNRAHDYFRGAFGFTERDEPLKVYAHMLEIDMTTQQAQPRHGGFYSPFKDAIYFGDSTGVANGGYNPSSRDADAICHEYTHAVVHRIVQLPGERDDFGDALNEAYASYFACTINNDPDHGEYTIGDPRGYPNMENSHRYPDDVNHPRTGKPQAHWTGIIWDGACWDLRKALGATVADSLVFRSIYYQPEYGRADFQTAARGVLEADRELYGSAHEEVIRRVMRERGILHD
jgi:Zn-dependent metalloprotease